MGWAAPAPAAPTRRALLRTVVAATFLPSAARTPAATWLLAPDTTSTRYDEARRVAGCAWGGHAPADDLAARALRAQSTRWPPARRGCDAVGVQTASARVLDSRAWRAEGPRQGNTTQVMASHTQHRRVRTSCLRARAAPAPDSAAVTTRHTDVAERSWRFLDFEPYQRRWEACVATLLRCSGAGRSALRRATLAPRRCRGARPRWRLALLAGRQASC